MTFGYLLLLLESYHMQISLASGLLKNRFHPHFVTLRKVTSGLPPFHLLQVISGKTHLHTEKSNSFIYVSFFLTWYSLNPEESWLPDNRKSIKRTKDSTEQDKFSINGQIYVNEILGGIPSAVCHLSFYGN